MIKTVTFSKFQNRVYAVVLSMSFVFLSGANAHAAEPFDIAIGSGSSATYNLGVGISSLVKVKLLPTKSIDLDPIMTTDDQESLSALRDGVVDFALVAINDSQLLVNDDVRALGTFGKVDARARTLLVRRDVDDAIVQSILTSVFDGIDFLAAIDPQLRDLHPDSAVMGLTLPLHRGAKQFYATWWSSPDDKKVAVAVAAPAIETTTTNAAPSTAATIDIPTDARNFILYFGFDDASLDDNARATLSDAAAFAGTLQSPSIIVAAYTDSVGDAEYNYLLAERRAESVRRGLDESGVSYGDIELSLFGERSPWAVTLDDVNEADNRRVELFIEEPVPEVQPLPAPPGSTENVATAVSGSFEARTALQPTAPKPAGGPVEKLPSSSGPTRPLM